MITSLGSADQGQDQLDAGSLASLNKYNFGRSIMSPSQLTASASSTFDSSPERLHNQEELLSQLLMEAPSPMTNPFDELWSAFNPQTCSSTPSDPFAAMQASFQDNTPSEVASAWSDYLMPLPAALASSYSDTSSSSVSSSSTFSAASSSSLNDFPTPAFQESGIPAYIPASNTPHVQQSPTCAWSSSSHDVAMQDPNSSIASTSQPQTQHSLHPTSPTKLSLDEREWPKADSLASWLDQDICANQPDHSTCCTSNCSHVRSGLPKARTSRPYSRRTRSSSNGITLVPLVGAQGLLWAAVMANGMAQGVHHSSNVNVASPESIHSEIDGEEGSSVVDEECQDEPDVYRVGEVLSPRSCPLSPALAQRGFEPMTALTAAGLGRSPSWSNPGNLKDLQHNLLTLATSSRRGKYRPSTTTGTSSRKQKMDAVNTSAVRRRRRKSRSSSVESESRPENAIKDNASCSSLEKALPDAKRTLAATSRRSSRASSFSRSASSSGAGAGSNSNTIGFSITDSIVLRPCPGSDNNEIAYPCASDSLQETQKNSGPPLSTDANGEEAVEKVQNLFPSDLYAPRFTRKGKCGREGWCSLCPQGDWYSMKRSQYLYHMQYDHGISNLTRRLFHPPQHLRIWNDAVQKTDGLCHHCKQWIPICFGPVRKRDFKAWFKHARKCHRDDTGCPI